MNNHQALHISPISGNTPHILIITDSMFTGGMQRQIIELLKGLKRNARFRTTLAILNRGGLLEAEAATFADRVLSVKQRARFDITPVFALMYYGHSLEFSIIHTFGRISGLAGLVVARLLQLPILNSGIRSAPPHLTFRDRISRWAMQHADMIVSNSQAGLEAYELSQSPYAQLIHNGLDLKRFEAVVPTVGSWPKICMVGNFNLYKDHRTVILAMEKIVQIFPNTELTLVGRDRGTLNESRQLVDELGLTAAVEFVTNTTHPEPYIASSDVCVLASTQNEGLSNVILEYMALSKPVVATTCMGNAELIKDEKSGFLVPSGSPEALAKRVIELLQAPLRAEQMGKRGQQRIVKEFSLNKMVEKYEGLYVELLTRRGHSLA